MNTINITLGEYFDNFIDKLLKTGRYPSENDIIIVALKMLQEKENTLLQLSENKNS
ncbi:ribbon-helix-helix domain-containing protein [Actinobacillus arthritidis]|uniref:ribbon-helix-helix domain-containing protein n=1 Tax=Actinobacillus arthritidis TaxID=157339 RepID=UPI002441D95B|nr:type II toxin-antitoxin system ParD family antitoxin [Actinobacillus arthritidis]WGE89015.1 type II toxin-antitoxin system ParD family antitoxin [Actinobacillus arthritidis]